MIGLIVLALAVGWLIFSAAIAVGIARAFAPARKRGVSTAVLFPFVLVTPFADEIIGRWQFHRLCESEAKVWVAPTANQVRAAQSVGPDFVTRGGFLIPVKEQPIVYIDAHTGQPFYTFKAFHTPGGLIMRAGLNLGHSSACWPPNWTSQENGIDIDNLLKEGKALNGKQR